MAIFYLQCIERVLRASLLVAMVEVVCRWRGIVTLTLIALTAPTKTTAVSVDLKQCDSHQRIASIDFIVCS